MKEVFRQSGSRHIKLGENIIEYNDAFRCASNFFFQFYSVTEKNDFSSSITTLFLESI